MKLFLNIILWVFQVLLAAQFLYHGWFFLAPPAQFVELLDAQFPTWFRLFLGTAEVCAGIGLILPGVTRILPQLVPLAALGIMIVTASASVLHFSRGGVETSSGVITSVLFVIAAFVACMRWRVRPIVPKRSVPAAS
jgi:uncharacterized membrane protein YphA (DoxX/SURF4 family)